MARSFSASASAFQSTPSARRATVHAVEGLDGVEISIHALREEGDVYICSPCRGDYEFQSTPSARRATAKAAKKSNAFVPLYTLVHNLKRNFTKAPAK